MHRDARGLKRIAPDALNEFKMKLGPGLQPKMRPGVWEDVEQPLVTVSASARTFSRSLKRPVAHGKKGMVLEDIQR